MNATYLSVTKMSEQKKAKRSYEHLEIEPNGTPGTMSARRPRSLVEARRQLILSHVLGTNSVRNKILETVCRRVLN